MGNACQIFENLEKSSLLDIQQSQFDTMERIKVTLRHLCINPHVRALLFIKFYGSEPYRVIHSNRTKPSNSFWSRSTTLSRPFQFFQQTDGCRDAIALCRARVHLHTFIASEEIMHSLAWYKPFQFVYISINSSSTTEIPEPGTPEPVVPSSTKKKKKKTARR